MLQLIYVSFKIILVQAFLPVQFVSTISNKCEEEQFFVSGTTLKAKWISDGSIENQVVVSVPPCFNNYNKLVTRVCINGSWYPDKAPTCEEIVTEDVQKNEDYWFNKKSTNIFVSAQQNREDSLVMRRTLKFGLFESTEIEKNYGDNYIAANSIHYRKYYSGDCLLFDKSTKRVKIKNCTSGTTRIPRNLPLRNCPQNCKGSAKDKCYCKSYKCQKLATVETFNDLKILKSLAGKDLCRVNDATSDISSREGLYSFLNGASWQYGNFETDCSLCETKALTFDDTKLVLSFEEERKQLYLLVYSPESIIQDDDEFLIFCFTNAAKANLKEKMKIELVFRRLNTDKDFPTSLLVYSVKIKNYVGEYWCEAFTLSLSLLRSDKVLAYQKRRGNEYTLRIVIDNVCKVCSCDEELFECLTDLVLKKKFRNFNPEIRIMEVFDFDIYKDILDVLVHVSTGKNYDVSREYDLCLSELEKLKSMHAIFFRSSEYCLPETTYVNGTELNWPLTKINSAVVPQEFCLMRNGTPIVRRCQGNFLYGGVWSDVRGYCAESPQISHITTELKEMANSNASVERVWNCIRNENLSILDIYYLNIILSKITKNESTFALDLVNKLMTTNKIILRESQEMLNLTDDTLESTDNILLNFTLNSDLVYLLQRDKLIVHVTNPFQTNISGLLIYGEQESLGDVTVENFKRGDDFEDIIKENLHFAVYVPEMILDQIANETENNISDIFIITTVFYNDYLFIDDNYRSGSFVISVSIPGYGSYLRRPIPMIFESKNNSRMCGFWNNGRRTNRKKGEWSLTGSSYVRSLENNLHVCSSVHLTHFALLLMSDKKNIADEEEGEVILNVEEYNEGTLEIITIIGSSLSILGILGIFLTAIFFKKWRAKLGTKILLNLAIAILLEIVCIQLSEIKFLKKSEQMCKIIGMITHYAVLSTFSWMLIYALLQYYRFVKVIGTIPNNLILKSVIAGWVIPLAVVFLVGLITTQSYVSSSYEICYPRGLLLYLSVLMPLIFITLANLTIFCLIMYNVTYKMSSPGDKKLFRLRLFLALLLFFALGIPWIFGILAELLVFSTFKIVLFYMFCITATLQGFALFLFYVVLNKETRECWIHYFRNKYRCCK